MIASPCGGAMAKVVITFQDTDEGPTIEVLFDPDVGKHELITELTDAQQLALKSQELLIDFLEKSGEMAAIDITDLDISKLN